MLLLNAACTKWGLDVPTNSFLGMGTFGRVFKVSWSAPKEGRMEYMALKLVLSGKHGAGPLELLEEKECMDQATTAIVRALLFL